MDTNSLTIDNMLFAGGTALAAPPVTKPITSANDTQYSQSSDNTQPYFNTPESTKTDNISTIAQKEPISKPSQNFNQTLRKAVKAESPQQDQKNTKPDKQYPTSELPSKINPAKSTLNPEIPITLGTLVKENSTKMVPTTGKRLAQLIANLKDDKSNPVTGQAVKSTETKLLESLDKGQLGIKIVLPDNTNLKDTESSPVTEQATKSTEIKQLVTNDKDQLEIKIVLPNKAKGQFGLKTVIPDPFSNQHKLPTSLSNISKGISTTNTLPGISKKNDEISASNSTVVTTTASTNVENTKKLIPDVLFNTNDNKAVTNEKASILATSEISGSTKSSVLNDQKAKLTTSEVSGSIKSFTLNGQKAAPNTLVDDSSKTTKEDTALMDKFIIHNNEKTPVLNANFPEVQNKITGQDSQPIGIVPEKSTQNANITTDSKTTNLKIISESSNSNNKETPNTGNKLSDDSTVRNLNIADVQISIKQSKKHNSTTHNNNSNSDSEQIPSQNNPVISVTGLSANSAEGTKTVVLPAQTSPNNISAEIGKQILDSIHSSFSHGRQDQQISVQLNPPELGKVLIKFQEQDNHITGLLEVSKTQTRIDIEQAIPQIIRSLQDSGIQIKRIDVVISEGEQPEQGTLREQTLQNGWAQQQDSADSYTDGDNPDAGEINEWLINNKSNRNISELQESLTANGSINMLI